MERQSWRDGAGFFLALTLVVLAIMAGLWLLFGFIMPTTEGSDGTPPTEETTTTLTPPTTGAACDPQEAITWGMGQLGFAPEDLRFEGNFDTGLPGVNDALRGSFSSSAILTKDQLFAMFGSTDPAAVAATEHMLSRLPAEERANALSDPSRWVGVQMNVAIVFSGNTYFIDGVAQGASKDRHVAPGDVWWFYVDRECGIHITAAVRAACGNPQTDVPHPVKPKPVPTTTTTSAPTTTTTSTTTSTSTSTTVASGKDEDNSPIDPGGDEDLLPEIDCPSGQVVNPDDVCVDNPHLVVTTTTTSTTTTTVSGNGDCAPGLIWNPSTQACESSSTSSTTIPASDSGGIGDGHECRSGQVWDDPSQSCVVADTSPGEGEDNGGSTPTP